MTSISSGARVSYRTARVWAAVLAVFLLSASLARAAERPNIIFLLTDDQRDGSFGAMGHPWVKTPHVDRLIAKSVRFTNTYIAEPTCSPSRVSLLTGTHERVHGVGFTSSYQLTEGAWRQTYPALLREAGYYTGFVGKFGVEYYTFRGKAREKFDFWYAHDGWTKFLPKDHKSANCKVYHGAKSDTITQIMGEGIGNFLAAAPKDKPFCLSVSFNVPHGSQTTSMFHGYEGWHEMLRPANENPKLKGTEFYDKLYRDLDIKIPADTATDAYRFIPKAVMDQTKGRNRTYAYNYTKPSCRENHFRYYQTISGLDDVIGDMLDDLKKRGLDENTVIIFGSDHGLLMGEYGMGGKALLYDLASKIPCFVYDPMAPKSQRGSSNAELVSSLDLTKTILDYAGVEAPTTMSGASVKPLVHGKKISWRKRLFLENLYTGRDTPFQEGIRAGKWKYVRFFDGKAPYREADVDFSRRKPDFEMLFDLSADPGERNNLVEKRGDSDVLAELRAQCAADSAALNEKRSTYRKKIEVQERGGRRKS